MSINKPWNNLGNEFVSINVDGETWSSVLHYVYFTLLEKNVMKQSFNNIQDFNQLHKTFAELYHREIFDNVITFYVDGYKYLLKNDESFKQFLKQTGKQQLIFQGQDLINTKNEIGYILMNLRELYKEAEKVEKESYVFAPKDVRQHLDELLNRPAPIPKKEVVKVDKFVIDNTMLSPNKILKVSIEEDGFSFSTVNDYVLYKMMKFYSNPLTAFETLRDSTNKQESIDHLQFIYLTKKLKKTVQKAVIAKYEGNEFLMRLLITSVPLVYVRDSFFKMNTFFNFKVVNFSTLTTDYGFSIMQSLQEKHTGNIESLEIIDMSGAMNDKLVNDKLKLLIHFIQTIKQKSVIKIKRVDVFSQAINLLFGNRCIPPSSHDEIVQSVPFEFLQKVRQVVNKDTDFILHDVYLYILWANITYLLVGYYKFSNYFKDSNIVETIHQEIKQRNFQLENCTSAYFYLLFVIRVLKQYSGLEVFFVEQDIDLCSELLDVRERGDVRVSSEMLSSVSKKLLNDFKFHDEKFERKLCKNILSACESDKLKIKSRINFYS